MTLNALQRRPRRNRNTQSLRALTQEFQITASDLVWPVFIKEGQNFREEISSMPGVYRLSLDELEKDLHELIPLGLQAIALFPIIEESLKDERATEALNENGFLPNAVRALKEKFPQLALITDVAMDPYSSDGHDGIVRNGEIINDESLEVLSNMALVQAKAGADLVAPSDMMDGRVNAIRRKLDEEGFTNVGILSYTAKYASSFYGPFRDALDSAPKFGDKTTYQMNPANAREALTELELDTLEGADIVMVKPAQAYLDIIHRLREKTALPIAAYQVSGEYAQLAFAAKAGALNLEAAREESLLCIKRAGADMIFSYFTPAVLRSLKK